MDHSIAERTLGGELHSQRKKFEKEHWLAVLAREVDVFQNSILSCFSHKQKCSSQGGKKFNRLTNECQLTTNQRAKQFIAFSFFFSVELLFANSDLNHCENKKRCKTRTYDQFADSTCDSRTSTGNEWLAVCRW